MSYNHLPMLRNRWHGMISGTVPGSWFLVLGSWFLVLGSRFLVLGSWFLVPGSWFLNIEL